MARCANLSNMGSGTPAGDSSEDESQGSASPAVEKSAPEGAADSSGFVEHKSPGLSAAAKCQGPELSNRAKGRPPRIASWWTRRTSTLGWLLPPIVVVMTGYLGFQYDATVVAFWLGTVAALLGSLLAKICLDPADYASVAAVGVGTVVGVLSTALLLNQAGSSLLSP